MDILTKSSTLMISHVKVKAVEENFRANKLFSGKSTTFSFFVSRFPFLRKISEQIL